MEGIICGHCGLSIAPEIVHHISNVPIRWLRCPNCKDGLVKTSAGVVYPTAPAGSSVKHLPVDVEGAWREARTSHSVAAYTASEIMCRKILMHIAVDKASATAGATFASYIDALDGAGYIAPGLKPVVDIIRTRGNGANHELPASTEDDSLRTLGITEHMLKTLYELPGLATP